MKNHNVRKPKLTYLHRYPVGYSYTTKKTRKYSHMRSWNQVILWHFSHKCYLIYLSIYLYIVYYMAKSIWTTKQVH